MNGNTSPLRSNVSNAEILVAVNNLYNAVNNLSKKIDDLYKKVDDISFFLDPMSREEFASLPVLGSVKASESMLAMNNSSTYTWVNYNGHLVIAGAAHCALYYGTYHDDKLFVQLPESVTKLGVTGVRLLCPYDMEYSNIEPTKSLPTKYDIIVIEVAEVPDFRQQRVPQFEKSTPNKNQLVNRSRLIGRSLVHVVCSMDGIVSVDTDEHSIGSMRFFLGRGEPGDSGTLMFMEKDGSFFARGIFVGVEATNPQYERRGRAATLPDYSALEHFPVLSPENVTSSLDLVDYLQHAMMPFPKGAVTVQSKGKNAVDLVYGTYVVAHGVIVQSKQRIAYVGKKDCVKLMRGKI